MHDSHPIRRARERYGLILDTNDLRQIALACATGEGRLRFNPDGTERHVVMVRGKALVIVYQPYLGQADMAHPHRGAGMVKTILPQEAALAGNQGSMATKFKRGETYAGRPDPSHRYRRGK